MVRNVKKPSVVSQFSASAPDSALQACFCVRGLRAIAQNDVMSTVCRTDTRCGIFLHNIRRCVERLLPKSSL